MPAANLATTQVVRGASLWPDGGPWCFTDVVVGDLDDVPERVPDPGTLVADRQVCNPGDLS